MSLNSQRIMLCGNSVGSWYYWQCFLRSGKADIRAIVYGIALICILNEYRSVKIPMGAFSVLGCFDHENAMAMFMTMCGSVLAAVVAV